MNIVASVEIKKRGVTESTGHPWTMYGVTLEDGRKASGFELVKVGDSVELEQKGKYLNYRPTTSRRGEDNRHPSEWTEEPTAHAPRSPPPHQNGGSVDVEAARKHLMQAANLYGLCIDCTEKFLAARMPEIAHTSEQFQSTLASIWIEASSRRSTDGVTWWSYIDKMPVHPIKK